LSNYLNNNYIIIIIIMDNFNVEFIKIKKRDFDDFLMNNWPDIIKEVKDVKKHFNNREDADKVYAFIPRDAKVYLNDIYECLMGYRQNVILKNKEVITQAQYVRYKKSIIAYLYKWIKNEKRGAVEMDWDYQLWEIMEGVGRAKEEGAEKLYASKQGKKRYMCPMEIVYYKNIYKEQMKKAESLVKDKVISEFVEEQKGEFAKCCNKLQIGDKQIPEVIEQHIDSFIK